jgi:hypothetical protein
MPEGAPAGKVVVYDGDCPICIRGSELFVRWRLVPEERRRAFQSYPGEIAGRLAAGGFNNEMAVLDPASGEFRMGIPGFLWLLRDGRLAPLARLLDRRWLAAPLTGLYHLISYNRRILAPPRRESLRAAADESPGAPSVAPSAGRASGGGIRCACDPDERPGYQLALLALLLVFATAATALCGAAAAAGSGLAAPRAGALAAVLSAGTGWAALFLAAPLLVPAGLRLKFLAHLGMVMSAGVLPLLAAAALAPLLPLPALAAAAALAVGASFALMLRQLARRLRYLGLSRGWLVGWAAALWGGLGAVLLLLRAS